MPLWKKLAIAAAALFTMVVLFVALVLPGIVRSQAEKKVKVLTGRDLSIRHVSINPLTLRVSVEGLKMQEPGGSVTFVSFSSASARLSPASIWRRAPIVTGIHVVSPYVHLVRTAANRYNFSDIPERLPKSEKKSSPSYFSLNNITVTGGSIDFDDQAAKLPKLHTLRQMQIAVPFISNIPYLVDKYVQPRFTAVVNGSPLDLKGRLKPFQKGMETLLDVNLTDLDIPFYAAYLPAQLPVQVNSGKFSSKIAVSYRVTSDKKPVIAVSGDAAVARLSLAERNGGELIAFDRFVLKINQADLIGGSYDIASISLDAPLVTVLRTTDGRWPHQRLVAAPVPASTEKEEKPAAKKEMPSVRIAEIRLNGGRMRFDDRLPAGGFRTELSNLTAFMTGFATKGSDAADYELSFSTTKGERLELSGDLALEPGEGSAALTLSGIPLEAYYPYLADRLTAPVGGKGEITAEASWSKEDGVTVDDLGVKLKDLSARYGRGDSIRIAEAALTGGKLDLKKKSASIASLAVRQAKVSVTKDAAGALSPLSLLRGQKSPVPAKPAKVAGQKPAEPFHYSVAAISGKAIDVSFVDESRSAKPRFDLRGIDFAANGITDVLRTSIPVRLNAAYGSGAKLAAKGSVTREPFRYNGSLQVNNLPIADFSPYFPEDLNIYLADGNLDVTTTVDITKGEQLTGSFAGNVGVRNLYALDTVETDDLLKWESLQVEDVRGTLKPLAVNVGGISLNHFLARLVVDRDGVINLKKIRATKEAPPGGTAGQPVMAQPVAAGPAVPAGQMAKVEAPRPEIRIDTVTLQDGTVSFLDQHTPQQFGTTMYNLGGRISGLSSEDFRYADLDLRGDLDKHSPLRITGKINPLSRELFADLKVRFSDIELSPVTPYAGTYLGYEIDKGKLFLDLTYKIEKKALQAENKVFVDQFTFGKGVESAKATKLPVRLAVALLKDQHGEIHLDLPVTGRTDDPEFSIFGVVLKMLKNLLVKAATAPFVLLQSAFGGGEDLSIVNFAHGVPDLSAEEKSKVIKLAGALGSRPGVKLEMTAFVDREKDAEGYRNELLRRKMKGEKFAALLKDRKNAPGDTPEKMEILPAEHDLYLKAVYQKEKFPKPRNAFGFVKDLPAPEMKKLILANTVIGEAQFQALSRERLAAVRAVLVSEGKLPAERIFEKGGSMYDVPKKDGQPASRVEFGVNAQ